MLYYSLSWVVPHSALYRFLKIMEVIENKMAQDIKNHIPPARFARTDKNPHLPFSDDIGPLKPWQAWMMLVLGIGGWALVFWLFL